MHFGSSLDWDTLAPIIQSLSSYFEKSSEDKIDFMNVGKFRITYSTDVKNRMFFIFLSDLTDAMEDLEKQLSRAQEEFMSMFEDLIQISTDQSSYASFNPIAERIHQNLRPKIALVGFSGVGKTTISRLIRAEEIPMEHVPTMTGDIVTIKIGKLYFHLWDFAGQEQFSFLWPQFIQDSDAVLIVSDSTVQNIDKSKFFIDLVKKEVPDARVSVIANKQDIPDAIAPKKIEKLLGVKTYGMVAVDPENRAKMIQIIGEVLDLSPQISPLIRPLLDRDKALQEAESLLLKGDFIGAVEKFRNIAALCRELGDDKLAIEFLERAKLIESKLEAQKVAQQPISEIPIDAKPISQSQISNEIKQEITPASPEQDVSIQNEMNTKVSVRTSNEPKESKPQPLESESSQIAEERIKISPPIIPTSFCIKINHHLNFINHNINEILSKNYLQINITSYDKTKISDSISNFSDSSLFTFFDTIKTQIDYNELRVFPNITLLENITEPISTASSIESESPSKKVQEEIESKKSQKSLEEFLEDEDIDIQDKIKYLKKELSIVEEKITALKEDLEQGRIPPKDYTELNKKLKQKKKSLQEKISDLSIQEIRRFDVSFPT